MTAVFHVSLYGWFKEIKGNLRGKKLHKTNWVSNFLGGSFNNRDNVRRAPIQFRRESGLSNLKDDFSLRTDPSILASIAWKLLDL